MNHHSRRAWRQVLGLLAAVGTFAVVQTASGQGIPQMPFTRGGPAAEQGALPLPEVPPFPSPVVPPPEVMVPVLPAVTPPPPAGIPPTLVPPPPPPAVALPPAAQPFVPALPPTMPDTPAPVVHPVSHPAVSTPSAQPVPTVPVIVPTLAQPAPAVTPPPIPPSTPAPAQSVPTVVVPPIPVLPPVPAVSPAVAPPSVPARSSVPPATIPGIVLPPIPPPSVAPPATRPPQSAAVVPPAASGMKGGSGRGAVSPPPPLALPASFAVPPASPPPPAIPPIPAPTTTPAPAAADKSFEAVWNNGLFVKSKDGHFSAHVGGTIHYDGVWYTGGRGVQSFPGGVGRFSDGANLRRMRIYMEGTLYKDFDYKFELEFMNGFSPAGLTGPVGTNTVSNSPGPTDAWVQAKNVPLLGNVRIGSQKEWFSLEHLEGYRSLLYLERSYLFDFSQPTAFNNGFSPGVSAFNAWETFDKRLFTAVGVYKNESDLNGYGVGDGNYAVTGRVAGLPVWLPDEQVYWHVGGAMSHRDPVGGQVQVRIRNEVRNAPFPLLNLIANTGAVNADSQTLFNLETAAAVGSLTLSAEYTANLINGARVGAGPNLGTLAYNGFYVQGMYFLTGEHRQWDQTIGAFKRVTPLNNFAPGHGTWGAWEVGGRYTYLNLDDKGVNGGRLNNVTLGTTWYWNPNVRLQFNYDYLYRDGGPNPLAKGAIHSLGTRLAMDF